MASTSWPVTRNKLLRTRYAPLPPLSTLVRFELGEPNYGRRHGRNPIIWIPEKRQYDEWTKLLLLLVGAAGTRVSNVFSEHLKGDTNNANLADNQFKRNSLSSLWFRDTPHVVTLPRNVYDRDKVRQDTSAAARASGNITDRIKKNFTSRSMQRGAEAQAVKSHDPPGLHGRKLTSFQSTTQMMSDNGYIQRRRARAVESYFRDSKFSGAPEQSIDNLVRDLEICFVQQCLDPHQMSLFFVNALDNPTRYFFLTQSSTRMSFAQIASIMRRHYNSDTRQLH